MTYGKFFYPEHETTEILTDVVFAACSPDFLDKHGPVQQPQQLLNLPLIHTSWGPSAAAFPSWRSWFEDCGIAADRRTESGLTANYSRTAIDLARAGLGVVLCQGMLASPYIKDRSLVRVADHGLKTVTPLLPDHSQKQAQPADCCGFQAVVD